MSVRDILKRTLIHSRNREIKVDEACSEILELLSYEICDKCCSILKLNEAKVETKKIKEEIKRIVQGR